MSAINEDSAAVQKYLEFLQAVISRMATNSNGCKTWCIALVSATIVIIADKGKPHYVWIAFMPLALFCFLDSYYLSLERRFRDLYNGFVKNLHDGCVTVSTLYNLIPRSSSWDTVKAFLSPAIWPFYVLLTVMLFLAYFLILLASETTKTVL